MPAEADLSRHRDQNESPGQTSGPPVSDTSNTNVIAIDVGNSRTKFGLFDVAAMINDGELPHTLRAMAVAHDQEHPWTQIRDWVGDELAPGLRIFIAGTRPEMVEHVSKDRPDGWPQPTLVDSSYAFPFPIRVDEPRKAGVDRLLTAVATNVLRQPGQAAIIVDSGTATTIDLVAPDGGFEGGSILPGFELTAKSLHHYTARLPYIPIEELDSQSREPLGRNTREALRSGLFWGQLGAIRELIAQLESGIDGTPLVLLCGGGAGLLAPHLTQAEWYPHLALQGLVLVARDWPT